MKMTPTEYHALGSDVPRGKPEHLMSQSQLTEYWDNPFKFRNGPRDKKTDSMTFGSIVDCLLLTPDQLDSQFIISPYPDFKSNEAQCFRDMIIMSDGAFAKAWIESPHATYATKLAKEWKAEQMERTPNATPLYRDKFAAVRERYAKVLKKAGGKIDPSIQLITGEDMREAEKALSHFRETDFSWIFDHGESQEILQWDLEGIGFKAMLDFVPAENIFRNIINGVEARRCLVDFKTSVDASEFGFRQKVRNFRHDIQADVYLTGWDELHPDDERDCFVWVVLENHPPYACACYALDQHSLGQAEHSEQWPHGWRTMLDAYKLSLDYDKWPDYNHGGPAWMTPFPTRS